MQSCLTKRIVEDSRSSTARQCNARQLYISSQFRFALDTRREGRAQTVQAVRQATADKVLCLTQIEINVFLSFGG